MQNAGFEADRTPGSNRAERRVVSGGAPGRGGAAAVRAPRPAQAPPGAVYRLVRSSSMTPAQLRP